MDKKIVLLAVVVFAGLFILPSFSQATLIPCPSGGCGGCPPCSGGEQYVDNDGVNCIYASCGSDRMCYQGACIWCTESNCNGANCNNQPGQQCADASTCRAGTPCRCSSVDNSRCSLGQTPQCGVNGCEQDEGQGEQYACVRDCGVDCDGDGTKESWSCTTQPSCSCSNWQDDRCGGGSCAADRMRQTRDCNPDKCLKESRCVDRASCSDSTDPTVSVISDPANATTTWQNTNARAKVSCSDSGTGCDSSTYRLKIYTSQQTSCPTSWNTYDTADNSQITSHSWVCGRAADNANNRAYSSPAEILIDKINSTGTILINGGNAYTNSISVTLALTFSDADSGVDKCRYSNDGTTWTDWLICVTSRTWILTDGDGSKTVYYEVRDNAGNARQTSDSIILDTIVNSLSASHSPTSGITEDTTVTITATASDSSSGLKNVTIYVDGGKKTCTTSPCSNSSRYSTGTHQYYAEAYDNVGNNRRTTNQSFTVGGFTITASPLSQEILRGETANYTVNITTFDLSGTFSLSQTCPSGTTCSFNPTSLSLSGSDSKTSKFSAAAASNSALSNNIITITATTGTTSKSTQVGFNITNATYNLTMTPKGGDYEGDDYIWDIKVADSSRGVTGRITYTLLKQRDGNCHGETDTYNGTDTDDDIRDDTGTVPANRRIKHGEFTIRANSEFDKVIKIYVRRAGIEADKSCTLMLSIIAPNGRLVDPNFTVNPPAGPDGSCTTNADCANYEYCDTAGAKTGTPNTCYDFRPEMTGCKYYDYCENGNIPGTPTPCSTDWDSYCYTANTEQVDQIRTICSNADFIAHTWFTCPIG